MARTAHRTRDGAGRQAAVLAAIHALRQVQSDMHRVLASNLQRDVSMADLLVLHQIAHGEGTTPGQIMATTGLTSGAVTSLIDRLETKGLVARRRSTEDRRVVVVTLAPDAHSRMHSHMTAVHAEAARLFEGWTVTRIHTLVEMLNDLHSGHDAT